MAYCIMNHRDVHYLTVNTHESPKNQKLDCVNVFILTRKHIELHHVAARVQPAIYTEDDKESQAEGAKCPEAG